MQDFLIDPSISMTEFYYNTLKDSITDLNGDIVPIFDFVPDDAPDKYIWISDQYIDQDTITNVDKNSYAVEMVQLIQTNITYSGYITGGKIEIQHINKQIIEKIITNEDIELDEFIVLKTILDNVFTTNFDKDNGIAYVSLIRFVSDLYQK